MANTTRKVKRGSGLPKNANTIHGLTRGYNTLFEKFGWMVLAKEKGYKDKVAVYKNYIDRWLSSAKHLATEYENHNRKHDINVMVMYVKTLKEYAAKVL